MKHLPFLLGVGAAFFAGACQSASSGGGDCSLDMAPYDVAASCRGSREPVAGICFSNAPDDKGLYLLCAVDGAGDVYVLQVESGQQFNAPGWTFGPQYFATSIFHVPAVPDPYEAACVQASMHATVDAIPVCSADAATE